MNKEENHILAGFVEECGEVIKEVCKAQRFGLDAVQPGNLTTPRGRLIYELNDLVAMVELLRDWDIIPLNWESEELKAAKKAKFINYMNERL